MAAVTLAVIAVHGCVADGLYERLVAHRREAAMPARIEVSYVREMALQAPPAVQERAAPKRRSPARGAADDVAPRARSEARPASLDAPDVSAPEPAASQPTAASDAPTPALDPDRAVAAASSPEPDPQRDPEPFEWPASTRLSYVLTGNYQGEVHGSAQVEWVRVGGTYQVHLDVTVGLPFAPLFSRRMTSEGDITAEGLAPKRYAESTKLAFRDARQAALLFEPDGVILANGQRRERLPALQDSTSQFVQLAWRFAQDPSLLKAGGEVLVPLALPRKVEVWAYDVRAEETVWTGFGGVSAVPLKPRRAPGSGGDLTAEIWFAPQLRYLPVRIRIHQSAETFIDLVLSRRPELAGS